MNNLDRISSINITWEPPFSLDLTDIEPDIIYCVEVYNISCQEEVFLFSDCNVIEPYYINRTLHESCLYNITVTARSYNDSVLNGTAKTRKGI